VPCSSDKPLALLLMAALRAESLSVILHGVGVQGPTKGPMSRAAACSEMAPLHHHLRAWGRPTPSNGWVVIFG